MKHLLPCFVLLLASFCGPDALALKSDQQQPIKIEADAATVDEKNGVSTYRGNVTVNQGSLFISADEVQIHSAGNEVVRIVARVPLTAAELVHYEQLPDNDDLISGNARTIVYFVKEERLEFLGEAILRQADAKSFSGETIQYSVTDSRVNAESSGDRRVITTIPPRQN
ncbi:MAG: lipopolysaccharide transport periplasmic protein LptA [Pseudomonadota bacterium]